MRRSILYATLLLVALLLSSLATGPVARAANQAASGFTVEFSDCIESIGVTLVPTERARPLVPSEFHLVGEGTPVTPLVVRTARCGIAVAGHSPSAGSIVQIGLVIVPPDFTGNINNYTLWYYTSDVDLARQLQRRGVAAQYVPTIRYDYVPVGADLPTSFFVAIPRPGNPLLLLQGTVTESETYSGSFVANWWQKVQGGNVKMNTNVPSIFVGSADLVLQTPPDGALGQLIGGGSTGFPVLQQFNTFPTAQMQVNVTSP
jgi:hypothetical protein